MATQESTTRNPLEQFNHQKARVIDFARRLMELATARKDTDAVAVLQRLARRFEDNRFLVVVVGEFKRGKSTLVNALVGRAVCPVHVTPKTARLTRILATPGGDEYVEIQYQNDRPVERVPLAGTSIADLVACDGARHTEVSSIDVYLAGGAGLLEQGVVLVDTPGLDSLFKDHDRITKDYLPRADLVLCCLSATQPLSAKERDFLLSYRHVRDKVLITLNHIDNAPDEERDQTIEFVKKGLRDEVYGSDTNEIPLFPLSARNAIKAREKNDEAALAASGVPALAKRIVEILADERGRPVLRAVADGQREVAQSLAKQGRAEREARAVAHAPGLRERCQQLPALLRRRGAALEGQVNAYIEEQCEDLAGKSVGRVEQWREQLKGEVRAFISRHKSEADCRRQLPNQLARHVQDGLGQYEGSLRERFKRVHEGAVALCQTEFQSMEREATETLAPGKARPGLAEMVSGLDALANLGAVANCLGGTVGGYGLASAAIEPAFQVPPGVKVLTVAAGITSVLAAVGGPIGWGVAVLGWLAAAIANFVHSSSWQPRVIRQLDKAVNEVILPRVQAAVTTEIWTFGRALQEHTSQHIRAVQKRLSEVVTTLSAEVVAGQTNVQAELQRLDDVEGRLASLTVEIDAFLDELGDKAPAEVSTAV